MYALILINDKHLINVNIALRLCLRLTLQPRVKASKFAEKHS